MFKIFAFEKGKRTNKNMTLRNSTINCNKQAKHLESGFHTSEMVLPMEVDDLSPIPGTHVVEGEKRLFHMCARDTEDLLLILDITKSGLRKS